MKHCVSLITMNQFSVCERILSKQVVEYLEDQPYYFAARFDAEVMRSDHRLAGNK